jgi:hypothetical protein
MNGFCDKAHLSRQPLSVVVTMLVIFSFFVQPLSLFAKPLAITATEQFVIDAPTLKAPANSATTSGVNYPPVGVPKLEWEPLAAAQNMRLKSAHRPALPPLSLARTLTGQPIHRSKP